MKNNKWKEKKIHTQLLIYDLRFMIVDLRFTIVDLRLVGAESKSKIQKSKIQNQYAGILLDFAFFAKALSNRIKAGLLTYSILCAFPKIFTSVASCTKLFFLELTVARQSVIFTRFPFNSVINETP
jgi:hypothetical protein